MGITNFPSIRFVFMHMIPNQSCPRDPCSSSRNGDESVYLMQRIPGSTACPSPDTRRLSRVENCEPSDHTAGFVREGESKRPVLTPGAGTRMPQAVPLSFQRFGKSSSRWLSSGLARHIKLTVLHGLSVSPWWCVCVCAQESMHMCVCMVMDMFVSW